jgi:hypothetical protein
VILKIVTDVETLSNQPNAAVIGIGMVAILDGKIIDEFEVLIDPKDAEKHGHVDVSTFQWWLDKPSRERAWAGDFTTEEAVEEVQRWLCDLLEEYKHLDYEAWANSPSFDYVILKSLWRRVGGYEWPLAFRSERDFRTMLNFAQKIGPIERIAPDDPHMPLSDARAEAQTLINLEHFLNEHLGHEIDGDLRRSSPTDGDVPPNGDEQRVPDPIVRPG